MGYLLLNYDVKWPNHDFLEGGYIPSGKPFGLSGSRPDENTKVMFRRRIRV